MQRRLDIFAKNDVYAIVVLFNWPIFVLYQSYSNHRLVQIFYQSSSYSTDQSLSYTNLIPIIVLFNWPIFVLHESYTNQRLIQLTNRRRFCSRALGAVTRTPSWFLQQILLVIEVVPLLLLTMGTFSIFKLFCHTLLCHNRRPIS